MQKKIGPGLNSKFASFAFAFGLLAVAVPLWGLALDSLVNATRPDINAGEAVASNFIKDFGSVISDGSVLEFDFPVPNPTDRTMAIRRVATSIPCCSAVGDYADAIPPGEKMAVPVAIRTEGRSGPLQVTFSAETDSGEFPLIRMVARIILLEELTAAPISIPDRVVPERTHKRLYRITLRSVKSDRREPPPSRAGGN